MRSARWLPAVLLGMGFVLLLRIGRQETAPLRAPLDGLPREIAGYQSVDREIAPEERRVAGASSYLMRVFGRSAFSVYVGYYDAQLQGQSIHSPKNCLPGAGWEPISSGTRLVMVGGAQYPVNRYVIGRNTATALVLYWYQGRGRISADEYRVKWELMRDKALMRRSEEALVRIVVPVTTTEAAAEALALDAARTLIGPLFQRLPLAPS